jgi:hypothetical protein
MTSFAPETPFHAAGLKDEANAPLTQVPDSITNFADDDDAVRYVQQHIVPLVIYVRDDGAAIRQEWGDIRRMLLMQHDTNQTYKGMSNGYLPVYARAHETRVGHVSKGLFPTDEYIEVKNRSGNIDPKLARAQADVLKAWMQYQFEKQMRFRSTVKPFLRQLYNYGISVGKVWYEKPLKPLKQGRTTRLPTIDQLLMDYGANTRACEGVRFKTRSMFSWFMWPPTVTDMKEATLVFEDIQMSKQYIEEIGKSQGWKNLELAIWAPQPSNVNSDMQELMQDMRGSPSTAVDSQRMGDKAHWVYLTEAYFTMPVPPALYRANEEPGSHVPVQVLLAGNVPVLIRRNPFWFQHAPYVVQKLNDTPDSFYGTGMGRLGKSLQHLANDFMNQTNDNATYGMNPVVIINPNLIVGPIEPIAPGRVWHMTDPSGIKFDRPPIEQMQYGMQLVSQLQSQMNDLLGAPPIMQGSNAKGNARTATGAQLLQKNVSTDLDNEIEDIELDVLVPLMEMAHVLGQQYQDKELQVATAGGLITVQPGDLTGEFAFAWLASSQAASQQMRSQQAMQLLQVVLPMVPLLMQQGYVFDPTPLIRTIAKEGMGFRDFDDVLKQVGPNMMELQVQMQGQMGQPGAPGAPSGPGGPGGPPPPGAGADGRSAVEQAPGGGEEMQEGEGQAFGEVRQNADALAGMMGGAP